MSEKPRILATRRFPEAVEARMGRDYDVVGNPDDRQLSASDIQTLADGCRGIICCPTESFSAGVIAGLPESVRIISTFSVGYDHIDVPAARTRGITVTNTPDVLTDATADVAFLCLLGAARMAQSAEAVLRDGKWGRWAPTDFLGVHVTGKRLGILGMGRIGQAVARRAKGFDMEVYYHNRRELPPSEAEGAVFVADPEEFLSKCDALSINCPLTPQTKGFLNAARIGQLPENAVVVNTARGPVVEDDALIEALKSGRVAAAGLDVFTGEPEFDRRYLELSNVFLVPHIGSATHETRNAMGFRCLDNLDAFFSDSPLPSEIR